MTTMIGRAIACFAVLYGFLALGGAEAEAAQHRYAGPHPLPDAAPGVFCHIEAPHVHVYEPERPRVMYRDYGGWHHFVGDPTPFGYEGPKHAYHGAHPIAVDAHVEVRVDAPAPEHVVYCYMEGPHYHAYAPVHADFEVKGGVHWYVGSFPPTFHERRSRYKRVNRVYARLDYPRPVVRVEPPAAYVDVLVVGGGPPGPPPHARGKAKGRAGVRGGVHVEVPVPSIEVRGSIGVGASTRARPPGHVKRGKGKGKGKGKRYRR